MKTSLTAGFSSFTPKSKFSLSKEERLKSSQQIAAVFAQSMSINSYPLLVFYVKKPLQPTEPIVKAAFTVSKKKFNRAVDRNRIKRLLRETYRQYKYQFYEARQTEAFQLVFVYTSNRIESFDLIDKKMRKLIKKLATPAEV